MKSLNVVMIVKNEAETLGRCLEAVRSLADGIILVDTGSSDRTKEIARSYGAKIFDFIWTQDFSAARNYALEQSDSDWNLVLDADEYLLKGSRAELGSFMEQPGHLGAVQRRDAYEDTDGINYGISYISRLLPRGVRYSGRIHEQVESDLPRLPIPLVFDHDGYLRGGKGERNLKILQEVLKEMPEDSYYLFQIAMTLYNMKQYDKAQPYFKKFCEQKLAYINYQIKGRILAIYNMLALGLYEDALELVLNVETELRGYADFQFACGTFYMKLVLSDLQKYLPYLSKIEESYLNCLSIGEVSMHEGVEGSGSFRAAYNLGTWYEVSGDEKRAVQYYRQSAGVGYQPAAERLKTLGCVGK